MYIKIQKIKEENKCLCKETCAYKEISDYCILSINDTKRTLQIIQNKQGNFGMLLGEIPINYCPMCGRKLTK